MKSILTACLTGFCMLVGIFLFSHLGYALEDTVSKDRMRIVAEASVLYSIPEAYPETAVVQDGSVARPGVLQVPYGKLGEYAQKLQKISGVRGFLPVQGPPAFSLKRYGTALGQSLGDYAKGNFGSLYSNYRGNFPLTENLAMMIGRTTKTLLSALAFAIVSGALLAALAAARPRIGKALDSGHSLLIALPEFLLVVLLQMLSIFLSGLLDRNAFLIIEFAGEVPFFIPFAAIALVPGALIYGTLRLAISREWNEDYILTARAKGLSRSRLIRKHVIRNILEDLFAVLPKAVSLAVGGAVVAEVLCQIFALGGVARNPVFGIGSFSSLTTICLTLGGLMFVLHLFFALLKKWLRVEQRREEVSL